MPDSSTSPQEITQLDELLSSAGLQHGTRRTLAGTWSNGERTRSLPRAAHDPRQSHPSQPVRGESESSLELIRAPTWEQFEWLHHGFSTRTGGVSEVYGPGSLNLGWTSHDEPGNVSANRLRFASAVAGSHKQTHPTAPPLIGLRQVHSNTVRVVERDRQGRLRIEGSATETADPNGRPTLKGDALMTDVPGILLAVGAADCVPVLVADVKRKAVAAFHAGWRGTLARIVERGMGRMRLRYGSRPEDLIAAVGPSIGPCCYSIGEDLRFDFDSQFAYAPSLFTEVYDSDPVRDKYPLLFLTARAPGHSPIGPQIHLNLWEANRRQLLDAGLNPERIAVVGECTACTGVGGQLKYFSHRGESGFAGRGVGAIGLAD